MRKPKSNEQQIGSRVYGDTNIFAKPVNYNYELRRTNEEKTRMNFIKFMLIFALVPFGYFLVNAEDRFRKAEVKQISSKRRKRLDAEHGITREEMKEDFESRVKSFSTDLTE